MNRVEDRPQLKLRIPKDIKNWLDKKSEEDERSINFIVTKALARAKAMEESL